MPSSSSSSKNPAPPAPPAPPPRLQFDDGRRIMEESGVSSSTIVAGGTGAVTQEPATTTEDAAAATITSARDASIPLETYYDIDDTCQSIVRRLDLVEKWTTSSDGCTNEEDDKAGASTGFLCRIALQFPDDLLPDSAEVCWLVEDGILSALRSQLPKVRHRDVDNIPEPLVFILGDTTYGPCCVDEVAALHLNADLIVHYGPACLSPTASLPVIYCFGRKEMDADACAGDVLDELRKGTDGGGEDAGTGRGGGRRKVLLLYDVQYHHAMIRLEELLRNGGVRVVTGQVPRGEHLERKACLTGRNDCCGNTASPTNNTGCTRSSLDECCGGSSPSQDADADVAVHCNSTDGVGDAVCSTAGNEIKANGRKMIIGGLEIPTLEKDTTLSDYILLYIGGNGRQLVNIMMRCSGKDGTATCWAYTPSTMARNEECATLNTDAASICSRELHRRFYLTQKARMAGIFGIVVGTLGVSRFRDVVSTLQRRIEDCGRTSYTFVVGKINVAKLANFAEVECFVLVACPENSMLDSRDFHVPVITPLELDVPLGLREWDGFYSNDFCDFLADDSGVRDSGGQASEEDDEPYFSLVSGRYESSTKFSKSRQISAPGGGEEAADLQHLPGKGQITEYHSEAAEFLKQREYQGLRSNIGQNKVSAATKGQVGIASDYGER